MGGSTGIQCQGGRKAVLCADSASESIHFCSPDFLAPHFPDPLCSVVAVGMKSVNTDKCLG